MEYLNTVVARALGLYSWFQEGWSPPDVVMVFLLVFICQRLNNISKQLAGFHNMAFEHWWPNSYEN